MSRSGARPVVVTGGKGQVASAISAATAGDADWIVLDRGDLDITDPDAVSALIGQLRPSVIINAAAFTAVDRAEAAAAAAFAINAGGAGHVAAAAAAVGAAMVQISTDFVFDGLKGEPYTEDDTPNPMNVYGESKLAGELRVQQAVQRHAVIRTSWLLGPGPDNFLSIIARKAEQGEPMQVVDDQTGTPTGVSDLATALIVVARRMATDPDAPTGVFHYAGPDAATRYQLAQEIAGIVARRDDRAPAGVAPCQTRPGPVRRPMDSRLDSGRIVRSYGVHQRPWRDVLRRALTQAGKSS